MAHSPAPVSPWPGVSDPLPFPGSDHLPPDSKGNIEVPDTVFARLREQIASGKPDLDVLLGAIAVSAQILTEASGAALGMRRDGTVVCVGRSGETAPALGARLSEESGISGECLRTGRTLRCDDTETDPRVDAEVCRHLGLRAIAAVPIRSQVTTIGILEVFSSSARAFTDEHLALLLGLAELADIATSTSEQTIVPALTTEANSVASYPPLPEPLSANVLWPQQDTSSRRKKLWYMAIAAGVVLVGLLSAATWRIWRETARTPSSEPTTVQASTSAPQSQAPTQAATLDISLQKPTPEHIVNTSSKPSTTKGRVVPASKVEDDVFIRKIDDGAPTATASPASSSASIQRTPVQGEPSIAEAPQITMLSNNNEALTGLLSKNTTVPKLDIRVSQGVSPLVLKHKVMPVYPRQALSLSLEGPVVLVANVDEEGKVAQVKQVSGHPVLGRAAMDAIKQWRYQPATLNGKTVKTETEITLKFKLP
jgi:TonB family protein